MILKPLSSRISRLVSNIISVLTISFHCDQGGRGCIDEQQGRRAQPDAPVSSNHAPSRLAREAKAIVTLAFGNGPIEDIHAGRSCPPMLWQK